MRYLRGVFLLAVCVGVLAVGAWADSVTYTTVADFQKADIKNGLMTFTDDGEII